MAEVDDANQTFGRNNKYRLRLSEAIGLAQDDIVIHTEIPHLKIQEHLA